MSSILFPIFRKAVRPLTGKGLGQLPLICGLFISLCRCLVPRGVILIECQEHRMYVDTADRGLSLTLIIRGIYEPGVTSLLKNIVAQGMTVVDIGANIGCHTLTAAKLVDEEGKVFAFEAEPHNFDLLVRNIELNGYHNVVPVQKAISDYNGKGRLFLDKKYFASHSLIAHKNYANQQHLEVDVQTLDDFLRNYRGSIDVIKMDVQGAELAILTGMSNIMQSSRGLKMITEFWPAGLTRFGYSPEEYLDTLLGNGFVLYDINEQDRSLNRIDKATLLKKYTEETHTNLYCARE